MELRAYIRILTRNWYLLLICFAVTVAATIFFAMRQPKQYQANTTFVIRPHSSLIVEDEFVRTLDTLSRRTEINNTFAEVASSDFVKEEAAQKLGLSNSERKGLSVSGRVLAGTNILTIEVEGNDPDLVQAFAEAVSVETINFVNDLYDVFELEQLDAAERPNNPSSPNTTMNIMIGVVLGLVIGIVVVFLSEYLRAPGEKGDYFDIIDSKTGVNTRAFFELRLRQEIGRANRHGRPLAIALITVKKYGAENGSSTTVNRELMSRLASRVSPLLRSEDVLARYNDTVFALLLPDMSGEHAKRMIEQLRVEVGSTPLPIDSFGTTISVHIVAGVVELTEEDSNGEILLSKAEEALTDANAGTYGKVVLVGEPQAVTTQSPSEHQGQAEQSDWAPVMVRELSWPLSLPAKEEVIRQDNYSHSKPEHNGRKSETLPNATVDESTDSDDFNSEKRITRAALKLARESGINIQDVTGTGKDGRITKADIEVLL